MIGIRPAIEGDLPAVLGLLHLLDIHHAHAVPEAFRETPPGFRDGAAIRAELERPDRCWRVAEAADAVVGLVAARRAASPPLALYRPRTWALVDHLAVDPAWRRRGLGRGLLDAVREWAAGLGLSSIQVTVWDANPEAAGFWGAMGFRGLHRRLEGSP